MSDLQRAFDVRLQELTDAEAALAAKAEALDRAATGLVDIDLTLRMVAARLAWCLHVLPALGRRPDLHDGARSRAASALAALDGLAAANVSEDQRGQWKTGPAWEEVQRLFEEFVLAGGGVLLEGGELTARRRRRLARAVVGAIRKFGAPDDRYRAAEPDSYPPALQRILLTFFPTLLREHPEQPPYGIEEGDEREESSERMLLPLSQAIEYLEHEVLARLREELAASPGDPDVQREIRRVEQKVEGYRRLRFFPRTESVLLEQGFQTETMTSYSADGEMLVAVNEKVTWRSGTSTDRLMEVVRAEVVHRLAGAGVCAELDREYQWVRSLESGLRGSSRTPSMRIDPGKGFRMLKGDYPALARLEDKEAFQELARMATAGSIAGAESRVVELLEADQRSGRSAGALGRLQ
jgi:hypothetical protein